MSVSLFDGFLTTQEMIAVFDDGAVVQAMFRFEEALARAQAAHGMLPDSAARAIAAVCKAPLYDIPALVHASRRAGSLAIPLVKELTKTVALYDQEASTFVHFGSTSQDVIDTAMVLVTRDAVALLDAGLRATDRHPARPGRAPPRHAGAGAHADAAGAGDQLRFQAGRLGRAAGARARAVAGHGGTRAAAAAGRRGRHAVRDGRQRSGGGAAHGGRPGPRLPGQRLAHPARRMGAARPRSGGAGRQPGQDRHRPGADGAGRNRRTGRAFRRRPRRLVGDAAQAQPGGGDDRAGGGQPHAVRGRRPARRHGPAA